MTQDTVQVSEAVFVGSGKARPACFAGRHVTPLPGVPYPSPLKRSRMKASCSTCSTGLKASPMLVVTRCTNAHSCWSDQKLYCGCLRATSKRFFTNSFHPCTFSASQMSSAALTPTKHPGYELPVTTFLPMPQKNPPSLPRSAGPRPRYSLLVLVISPTLAPVPASSGSVPGCARPSPPPLRHPHTMAG